MFSSRLEIDVDIAPGRLWLRNLYHVHQRLCMAFPSASRVSQDKEFLKPFKPEDFGVGQVHVARGDDSGFLFRIDLRPGGSPVILVQSAIEPNWDYAFQNARYLLTCDPQVKSFELSFQSGQVLRFRLLSNPTRKIDTKTGPDGKKNNGQRVPVRPEKLEEWLSRQGERCGFSVEGHPFIQTGYTYWRKPETEKAVESEAKKDTGRRRVVRYEGVLRVTNAELFLGSLTHGIGPGKAFGFGLLSVAPLRGEM